MYGWCTPVLCLDRGVGSPVYMVNQTTRHQMRTKIRSWDRPEEEEEENEGHLEEEEGKEDHLGGEEEEGYEDHHEEEEEGYEDRPGGDYFVSGSCGGRTLACFLFYCSHPHKTVENCQM